MSKQTIEQIEFILIDDGSTDRSGKICDSYSMSDSRFIVTHKENEGLSAARNDGIRMAKAEYIMFVDSDDWVEPNFCEVAFSYVKKFSADIVLFGCYKHGKLGLLKPTKRYPFEGVAGKGDVLTKYWLLTGEASWNKIYRKSLFNHITYPMNRLCEDSATTYRVVNNASVIATSNKRLYHYRAFRPGSISSEKTLSLLKDYYCFEFERIDKLKKWGYDYSDEQVRIALSYLVTMGRNKELSIYCDQIMTDYSGLKHTSLFFRHKIMIWLYKASHGLFDLVAIVSGKRIAKKNVSKKIEC